MNDHVNSTVKVCLDLTSLGVLSAWWAGIAPAVATTLTIIWVGFCIVEAAYKYYRKYKEK